MKKIFLKILNAPWYWVTFAAYPVLALLANNISQVRYTTGIRPLGISLLGAFLVFFLFRLIYREWHRAAFATAGLTMLFYSYGQVYGVLSEKKVPHLAAWLGGAWILLAVLVLAWGSRRRTRFQSAALVLNVVSLGLSLYVLIQVITEIPAAAKTNVPADPHAPVRALHVPAGQNSAGYILFHPGFIRAL